jgi:hypothetical protein
MGSSLQHADPVSRWVSNRSAQQHSLGMSVAHRQRTSPYCSIESNNIEPGKVARFHDISGTKESNVETDQTDVTIRKLRVGPDLASSKLPFLCKLHILLQDVENTGDDLIVSWLPHGRGFKVYMPKAFITKIAPFYFKQSKYKSFQRQLHLYEFTRTPYGPEAGSYSHPSFVRGIPNSCLSLSPIKLKGKKSRVVRTSLPPPIAVVSQSPVAREDTLASLSMNMSQDNSSTGATILPSKGQTEWISKIRQMLVNGATPASQICQEQGDGVEPKTTVISEIDDKCYAFGSAFHTVSENDPSSENDPFSRDYCCAIDDEAADSL